MMDALRQALENVVVDVVDGSPPGPLFASRVKRECTDVLRRHGVQGRVFVMDGGQRVHVEVKRGAVVERIVLSLET